MVGSCKYRTTEEWVFPDRQLSASNQWDPEMVIIFLRPSTDFPQLVPGWHHVKDNGELGELGDGGGSWGEVWWLGSSLRLPFCLVSQWQLLLVFAQVLVGGEL